MHPDALYFIIYSKADDLLVSGRVLEFIGLNSRLWNSSSSAIAAFRISSSLVDV